MKFNPKVKTILAEIASKQEEAHCLRAQLQMWEHVLQHTGLDSDDCVAFGLDVDYPPFLSYIEDNLPRLWQQIRGHRYLLQKHDTLFERTGLNMNKPRMYNYVKTKDGEKYYFVPYPAPPAIRRGDKTNADNSAL